MSPEQPSEPPTSESQEPQEPQPAAHLPEDEAEQPESGAADTPSSEDGISPSLETAIASTEAIISSLEDQITSTEAPLQEGAEAIAEAAVVLDTPIVPPTPARGPSVATPPGATSTGAQSQTLQKIQEFWRETQPKLKSQTIRLLKGTIQLLETVVARLEAEPLADTVASPGGKRAGSVVWPDWVNQLGQTLSTGWQRFWRWWNTVLPKIRGVLPASVNQALSDRALSGAIAAILVIVLWTTSSLLSSKPPTQVATAPPGKSVPVKPRSDRQPVSQKQSERRRPKETREKAAEEQARRVEQPTPSPSPEGKDAQPDRSKPGAKSPPPVPKPSPSPTPKPAPPPLQLTPEQKLIARIQDQVADVSNQYVSGLIQSVQANFRSSRLTVKVGNGWYTLTQGQQDKLANDILQRAQQLSFSKLEIAAPDGGLLARSPVVGSEMVVIKRNQTKPAP